MDFGVSGGIEKFEQYWGTRATKALLFIVGLGIASLCINAVWQSIVLPLVEFSSSPLWGKRLGLLGGATLGLAGGSAIGILLAESVIRWKRTARTKHVVAEALAMLEQTDKLHTNSFAMLEVAALALQAGIETNENLTAEQKAEISERVALAQKIAQLGGEQMSDEDLNRFDRLIKTIAAGEDLSLLVKGP